MMPLFQGLWGIMKANPIGTIITIVGLLVTAFMEAYEHCEWFRDGVNSILDAISDAIDWVADKLDAFFSFDWVSDVPIIGDIVDLFSGNSRARAASTSQRSARSVLSAPTLPVKWFARGGILNSPTVFGTNGKELLAGGEAVLPIDLLRKYIREENQTNNTALAQMIREALAELSIVAENNVIIGDKKLESIVTDMVIKKISAKVRSKKAAKGK